MLDEPLKSPPAPLVKAVRPFARPAGGSTSPAAHEAPFGWTTVPFARPAPPPPDFHDLHPPPAPVGAAALVEAEPLANLLAPSTLSGQTGSSSRGEGAAELGPPRPVLTGHALTAADTLMRVAERLRRGDLSIPSTAAASEAAVLAAVLTALLSTPPGVPGVPVAARAPGGTEL